MYAHTLPGGEGEIRDRQGEHPVLNAVDPLFDKGAGHGQHDEKDAEQGPGRNILLDGVGHFFEALPERMLPGLTKMGVGFHFR